VNSSRNLNLFMNPFLMWSRLAWKTGEMAIASAQIIGHRTGRFALAGPVPSARDQREFALMGHEKNEADWRVPAPGHAHFRGLLCCDWQPIA